MDEEFERERTIGSDGTASGSDAGEPVTEPARAPVSDPGGAREPEPAHSPRATNAGRIWISIGVATVLLILLIIFIAENSGSVTISFLGAHGRISLGLALLIAAVVGAAVTLLAGTARILQLRLELRRSRRRGSSDHVQPR